MGHGALFVKYEKPSYKVHVAILLSIIAVSVYLSFQVSKNKNSANLIALKQPVPIDSAVKHEDLKNTDNYETNVEPQQQVEQSIAQETGERQLASQITLASYSGGISARVGPEMLTTGAYNSLQENSSAAFVTQDQLAGELSEANSSTVTSEFPSAEHGNVSAENDELQNSTGLIEILENTVNTDNKQEDNTALLKVVDGQAVETKIDVTQFESELEKSKGDTGRSIAENDLPKSEELAEENSHQKNSVSLDEVYNKQQQNFFSTLAKSVEKEGKAEDSIKKMRAAIRNDKTVVSGPTATDATETPIATTKQKIASLDKKLLTGNGNKAKNKPNDKQSNTNVAKVDKPVIKTPVITRGELNNVLSQFTYYYNSGDVDRLISLFSDKANTNGQKNKQGIKQDYADLFNNTVTRRLKIKSIAWDLNSAKALGAAEFEVVIQPKNNSSQRSIYKGSMSITAIKNPEGIQITRLFHKMR